MEKLYVIDASAYLYGSYFAIRNMTNAKGESTNALFGFTRSLMKLMKDFHPTHLVAVFDGPYAIKARKELYQEYKAHRQATPDDLRYQIERAQQLCQLLGVPWLSIPEVEADDTMGSIAHWTRAKRLDGKVYLCSGDKDLCQLVDDKVLILNIYKDNLISGPKEVEEAFGVPPSQMIDYLAIVGDASDNVPGLPGFGPKTAAKMLTQFGSLENMLANASAILEPKKRQIAIEFAEQALLSQKLVTINCHVSVPHQEDFYALVEPSYKDLREFYASMGFQSLIREIDLLQGPPVNEHKENYTLINDEDGLRHLLQTLSKQPEICFETETTDNLPMLAELVGIGFGFEQAVFTASGRISAKREATDVAADDEAIASAIAEEADATDGRLAAGRKLTEAVNTAFNHAWYVPLNGDLGQDFVLKELKTLFEHPHIGFYSHNSKYDLHVLSNYGIEVANLSFDTILASYLLNAQSRQHSLDALALERFNKIKMPIKDLTGKGKNEISLRAVSLDHMTTYCCEDVDYTIRLKKAFEVELAERGLQKLFFDMELPLLTVLKKMEQRGIFLNIPYLQAMSSELTEDIAGLQQEIYAMAGQEFNINSPKQLVEIFHKLNIKSPKKTSAGQMKTDSDVLESLKNAHPIAGKLLEYRTLEKLRSTYVDSLPSDVNPKTGRIHCTFTQSVATGRLSCQNPNLQNIPVRTEVGRRIREAFCPQKSGWSYLAADYSQIELRLLAHFSEDPNLILAFEKGEDVHAHTASIIFNVPLESVNKEMRHQAKAVNFGVIYGQQAFGLSQELGIDVKAAAEFIETYFKRYNRVRDFVEMCKEKVRQTGRAVTLTGRERLIPEINSRNTPLRLAAERLATNTPLQGTAADIIKLAMLACDEKFTSKKMQGGMVLQIHDELIFEVPDEEIPQAQQIVRHAMEEVMQLKVPLIVDISIGKNWKEC